MKDSKHTMNEITDLSKGLSPDAQIESKLIIMIM
jgi:hypothetical protein